MRVLFVGGAEVGLGFLATLLAADNGGRCTLLGAVPAHKSESVNPLIVPFAADHGIDVRLKVCDFKSPDLIVSAGNHHIFTREEVKRAKIVNLHAAPLPHYAGSAAMAWAILNEEKEFGVTFHYASAILDAGKLLHYEPFPIGRNMTSGDINQRCTKVAISTFHRKLEWLLDRPQGTRITKGTRPPYKRAELEPFRRVDLSWPQDKIWRHIRAFDCDGILQPAYTQINGKNVFLTADARGSWL